MQGVFRRMLVLTGAALTGLGLARAEAPALESLASPVLFRGDATTAYRDPAAVYVDGWFRLFFTLVKIEGDGQPYSYAAWSKSRDLARWSEPQIFTPRDRRLNYGSPGSLVRSGGEWVLCLQTYPRPNGERYGNADSRLWTMRSRDLESWGAPELMRVKGSDVPQERMGRMIDPCLVEDFAEPGAWWCFYKTGAARSRDLRVWTPEPQRPPGENPCVIRDGAEYVMAYAPANGVGLRRSANLRDWRDEGVLTLGQQAWPWAQGRLTGGFLLDLRRDPAVGKVLLFFHGSDFPEEDPRGGFDNFASVGVAWSEDLKTWSWPQKTLSARLATHNGRRVFEVNGHALAPLMYSGTEHSRDTWADRPRQSLQEFAALGYEVFQTDLWLKYSLRPDGTFDMEGVRRQLGGILDVKPDAKLVVRINVSAPSWWLERHTNEICRVTAPALEKNTFGGNRAESLASEAYAAFARESLKAFLQQLARTPEGDRVIGFHIGGGVYGEWHYYGIYQEPDASEPMRRRFAAYGLARYGSLDAANRAWGSSFPSEDAVEVPSFARRYETADGDFRDPQRDAYVIDYYRCQQQTVSELVDGLCRLTKETWPRPALVGLFYGYFFGGWTVGAQASQFDVATLFKSPYVDYFAGPYSSRNMTGSGYFRTLADSVTLNGKVWLSEHDGGTHLGSMHGAKWPDLPRNEAESVARMRRNAMYTLTENAGQWWYDFGPQNRSGWWSTPALLAEAQRLLTLHRRALERPYEKPSEILLVHDMEAFNYVRPAKVDKLSFPITEGLSDQLLGTGAALDRIFLMDLAKVDLAKYKLVVFGNVFTLDARQRELLRNKVVTPGRSVVFLSGAGYTEGARSGADLVSDAVGLRVEKADGHPPLATMEWGGLTSRLEAPGVTSLFKVVDAGAQALARYPNGDVAAALKRVNGARVYYFGLPPRTDLSLVKALAREAGARCYVEGTVDRDYVAVGGGVIGLYSAAGGEKLVRPQSGGALKVNMAPFSARYFDFATGEELTK